MNRLHGLDQQETAVQISPISPIASVFGASTGATPLQFYEIFGVEKNKESSDCHVFYAFVNAAEKDASFTWNNCYTHVK